MRFLESTVPGRALFCTSLAFLLWACGGGSDDARSDEPDAEFEDPGSRALLVASMDGCLVDVDCAAGMFCYQQVCAVECRQDLDCAQEESCSERGRCLDGDPVSALNATVAREAVLSELRLAETPEPLIVVAPGQQTVSYALRIEGEVPNNEILYRMERNDALDAPEELYRATADSEGNIVLELPVGAADPDGDNLPVSVRVALPFTALRVVLQPLQPAAGEYLGEVRMDGFGNVGLPIELRVHTNPEGASLEQASEAWLGLRVAREHLFSPVEAVAGGVEWVYSELEWDSLFGVWVATFSHAFNLSGQSHLDDYASGQVRRQLRFELNEPQQGYISGTVADRWSGLFDQRTLLGAPQVGVMRFDGDLEVSWLSEVSNDTLPDEPHVSASAPELLPAPSLDECNSDVFATVALPCGSINDTADFAAASVAEQIECATAVAVQALAGDTTASDLLAFLDDSIENPNGASFAEYMEMCATGEGGTCRPSAAILCGRQLIASSFYAYGSAPAATQNALVNDATMLVTQFQELSREAFLGRQLGAFQTDVTTRLEWLQNSELPAIVTAVVQSATEDLLDDWQQNVLEVHMETLAGQFDPAGVTMLAATVSGEDAASARRRLLAETTQSWRGAMESLVLGAQRWDALLQDESARAEKAALAAATMRDLYLMAGMLYQFNLESGAGYRNASLAGGFGNLIRQSSRLELSFEELAYARDAEVVVSTSLNPLQDNDSLLTRLRVDALDELEDAADAIFAILQQTQAEALDEELLRQSFQNNIRDLRSELAELCGIPVGCTPEEARTDEDCYSRVAADTCGFVMARGSDLYLPYSHAQFATSEGGRLQLEILTALQGVSIAQAELDAHIGRSRLELTELERFAGEIEAWNGRRLDRLERMETNFARRDALRDENLRVLFDGLNAMAASRREAINAFQGSMAEWNAIRVNDANESFATLSAQMQMESAAAVLSNSAELSGDIAAAIAEGMPKAVGTSTDPSAPARGAVLSAAAKTRFAMRAGSIALEFGAQQIAIERERGAALADAELASLNDRSTLESMISDSERALLEDRLQRSDASTASELEVLNEALQLLDAEAEASEAYARDRDEFLQRRLAYQQRLHGAAELRLRIEQAQMRVQQRQFEYLQVVQRAELIEAQVQDIETQLTDIEVLIGSPAAVFARANRLAQAESRLQRAKSAMMDWLVAMEYYAVRPFMDQRIQILLAQNTYQLEEIAAELQRIENRCGGAVNEGVATFSVRDDFLELQSSLEDPISEEVFSPAERFQQVLRDGAVPVNKRIRYNTDSNVGSLMRANAGILAATFTVNLTDYANLANSCNAKITGVRVQLVGDDLGDASPTLSLLYDGTSQLRSCQPDVDDLAASYGPAATNFGSITTLRTEGRSISPVAGINAFVGSPNQTLSGLPLSTQYTVLIAPNVGENRRINWDNLEDIRLELTYGYQDVFPQGQCQ